MFCTRFFYSQASGKKKRKRVPGLLLTVIVICGTGYPAVSGDNDQQFLQPVGNQAYKNRCGACHFAYQPELLPSASWQKILDGREDHFGEIVDLDDEIKTEILKYLQSNPAETSTAELAVKIMSSLGNRVPARITDIPYIQKKHMGIPPDFINRKVIGSRANCVACHATAESGDYDDDHVKIPR